MATFSYSGFTFGEVGCIRTRNSKVTCCHFSSDGKLLASAGHDKKVYTQYNNTCLVSIKVKNTVSNKQCTPAHV